MNKANSDSSFFTLRSSLLILLFLTLQVKALEQKDGMYLIATADDLEQFANLVNSGQNSINAVLVSDIDYRGHNSMIGDKKISSFNGQVHKATVVYQGTFNGQAHKVTVDYRVDFDDCALFRYVGVKGRVINLHVSGSINTSRRYAAGIVADLEGGELSNCLSTVNINSTYAGDCTLGGIVGFSKGNSKVSNCVYVGSIHAPKGIRVGGLIGWVDAPHTRLQNCLVICQAQVASLENSNSVARSKDPEYIILDNVRYVNDINQAMNGAQKIKMEEFLSGETYYKIFETQLHEAEEQIQEKDHQLHTYLYFIFGGVAMLVLQGILLAIYYVINKRIRRKLRHQYEDFERVKAQLAALTEVKELPEQTATEEEIEMPEVPADEETDEEATPETQVELNEEQLLSLQILYQKLLAVMDQQQLYTNPKLNLAMLAREMCTNQSRLSLCINKISGQNLSNWLGHYRVNHAMKLMDENPEIREEEIREQAGFPSHSSYYRIFHKVTGYTPKQYIATRVLSK